LDINDYKGLGMVSFPIIAHLNFGGLSALDKEGKFGWTIGGGIQYNKTELYYLNNGDEENGVTRDLFKTIVAEIGYGFGMTGFTIHPFIRYGWNPDNTANSFNFGIRYDFNIPKLRQISDPNSEL
jgi:opacity protein-like surface antigen